MLFLLITNQSRGSPQMVSVHIYSNSLAVSPPSSLYFSSSAFLHQIRIIHQIMGCHVVAMPYPGRGHINPMMINPESNLALNLKFDKKNTFLCSKSFTKLKSNRDFTKRFTKTRTGFAFHQNTVHDR